jgi:hypothetical protein
MTNQLQYWREGCYVSDSGAAHPLAYIIGEASTDQIKAVGLTTAYLNQMLRLGKQYYPQFSQSGMTVQQYGDYLFKIGRRF